MSTREPWECLRLAMFVPILAHSNFLWLLPAPAWNSAIFVVLLWRSAGMQVNDAVVFAAEVLVLRESCDVRHLPLLPSEAAAAGQGPPGGAPALPPPPPPPAGGTPPDNEAAVVGRPPSAGSDAPLAAGASGAVVATGGAGAEGDKSKTVFTWRIENFQAFKVRQGCSCSCVYGTGRALVAGRGGQGSWGLLGARESFLWKTLYTLCEAAAFLGIFSCTAPQLSSGNGSCWIL